MAESNLARKGREQGGRHQLKHKDRTRKRSEEPSNPPPSPPLSYFKSSPFISLQKDRFAFLTFRCFFSSLLSFPPPYSNMFSTFLSLSSFFSHSGSSSSTSSSSANGDHAIKISLFSFLFFG